MPTTTPRDIALVGLGAIAHRQHAPFLTGPENATGLRLAATVDPHRTLPGFDGPNYPDLAALFAAGPEVGAIAIATPTALHFPLAREGLLAGRHVLLEKPPTTTPGELRELERLATGQGRVLVTAFHARHNPAVARAREMLAGQAPPRRLRIEWREDFDRWHPGQAWPWEPGGFGVFDPGINALSVLCDILPDLEFRGEQARVRIPAGAATPALVEMRLAWPGGEGGDVAFEWRHGGTDVWDITLETETTGTLLIRRVRTLLRDGATVVAETPNREYAGVYAEFAAAIERGESRVSERELRLIEAATAIAEVERRGEAF